jgi:hypothetical protein
MSPTHSSSQAAANGQGPQDNVHANMLTLTQQPGCRQQCHQIENVFGEFIAHRYAAAATLRDTTSAPIMTVMISRRRHATRRAHPAAPIPLGQSRHAGAHRDEADRSLFLREKFLDLRAVFGALLDDALPAGLVGLAR